MRHPSAVLKPEIVIGLIAKMGTDLSYVITELRAEAAKYNFLSCEIRVTDFLKLIKTDVSLCETGTYDRYTSFIEACNKVRERADAADIFSKLVAAAIREKRASLNEDAEERGIVYIVNQLKTPQEILALRHIYGEAFFAMSCYSPLRKRRLVLQSKLRLERHTQSEVIKFAEELLQKDEKEEGNRWGQNVRAAFPLADFIIDSSRNSTNGVQRLFSLMFGDVRLTPTFDEYANNIAAQAALRSADLSRQVGAAIFDSRRMIMSLGCNEVPKSSGGTYWEDSKEDGRDILLGHDKNTLKKREYVIDIVQRLAKANMLTDDLSAKTTQELYMLLLDSDGACLRDAPSLDILEYGRALHAEMNAITDAARQSRSCQDGHMYVTTFPCHNCAKHIVGSGIKQVIYVEPYPKSQVEDLYPDSIVVDPVETGEGVNKVVFRQFCGVMRRRFHLFGKSELKEIDGRLRSWDPSAVGFVISVGPAEFDRREVEAIGQIEVQWKDGRE